MKIEHCYNIILSYWKLIVSADPWFQLLNWNLEGMVRYEENY